MYQRRLMNDFYEVDAAPPLPLKILPSHHLFVVARFNKAPWRLSLQSHFVRVVFIVEKECLGMFVYVCSAYYMMLLFLCLGQG